MSYSCDEAALTIVLRLRAVLSKYGCLAREDSPHSKLMTHAYGGLTVCKRLIIATEAIYGPSRLVSHTLYSTHGTATHIYEPAMKLIYWISDSPWRN